MAFQLQQLQRHPLQLNYFLQRFHVVAAVAAVAPLKGCVPSLQLGSHTPWARTACNGIGTSGNHLTNQPGGGIGLNAKIANDRRPPNVMRAYRMMESNIRFAKRRMPDKVEKWQLQLERFRRDVSLARARGALWELDRALGQRLFSSMPQPDYAAR